MCKRLTEDQKWRENGIKWMGEWRVGWRWEGKKERKSLRNREISCVYENNPTLTPTPPTPPPPESPRLATAHHHTSI